MSIEEDLISLLSCFSMEKEQIDYECVDGLIISTIFAGDIKKYETAIKDKHYVYPVERYDSLEEAKIGHKQWAAAALNLTKVIMLGYGVSVADKEVELVRF